MWLILELIVFTTIILAAHTTVSVVPTANGWEGRGGGFTGLYTGPYFDTSTPTNITTQLGTHAFLPCKIRQLGNKSVSWIRQRDSHILTVDRYTFIADERFQVLHNNDVWTLQIKFVQPRDAGVYECQITSEPKLSQFIHLEVVVPQTKILGESDVFVKSGSTVQIKCVITQNLEQPSYIFWYHDQERVNLINEGKYSWVDRVNTNTTIGTLVIKSTVARDSGNYTCAPSNIESASVMLHVLNGEHPAAMQQESRASLRMSLSPCLYFYLLITFLVLSANASATSVESRWWWRWCLWNNHNRQTQQTPTPALESSCNDSSSSSRIRPSSSFNSNSNSNQCSSFSRISKLSLSRIECC